jgi:hypothetical protein
MAKKKSIEPDAMLRAGLKAELKDVKVMFKNTYIGLHGNFTKGNIYTIPIEIYNILKEDCSEISERV